MRLQPSSHGINLYGGVFKQSGSLRGSSLLHFFKNTIFTLVKLRFTMIFVDFQQNSQSLNRFSENEHLQNPLKKWILGGWMIPFPRYIVLKIGRVNKG